MMEGVFSGTPSITSPRGPHDGSHWTLTAIREAVILSPRIYPTKEICPDFVLSTMCHGRVSQKILQVVLSPFSSCEVKRVRHLDLDLVLAHCRLGQCATNLRSLLNSLANFHKLYTTAKALEILSKYGTPDFRLVHTISFHYFIPGSTKAVGGLISSRKLGFHHPCPRLHEIQCA